MTDHPARDQEKGMVEKIEAARRAVADLCTGRRKWTMTIPVRMDSDQDMIITDALDAADAAQKRIAVLEAALRAVDAWWGENWDCSASPGHDGYPQGVVRAALEPGEK